MNFAQFFIKRPIFATVMSILIMIVGGISFYQLPIAQYPDIVPPTVQVTASFPGASPDVLTDTVATPLEQEINGVENMLYLTSSSTANGAVSITVTFEPGTDIDEATVLVQNRVARAEPSLPEIVRGLGVVTQKASPDLLLVAHLTAEDDNLSQLFVGNYAFLKVRDELLRLKGVGAITVFGASEYGMRVWLDPQKLAARDLTTTDVTAALTEQNIQVAAGSIGAQPIDDGPAFTMSVRALGRLESTDEFGNIIIKTGAEGQIVHLSDVARLELGAQEYGRESYLNGLPAIGIGVTQRPGSNALETAKEVEELIDRLAKDFPPGLSHQIVFNPTVFVEQSIDSVIETLFEAIILVILVIIIFLQNWRSAIIPLAAIPVSLIGTFMIMSGLGYSLNNLSLFGLVLAIGIVVDDAIVVIENVERHLEDGLSPIEAAQKAMREVSGALIATTLVLVAVFLPTLFIAGLSGQFYQQFAVTIAASTVISTVVSLTLSPALCAVLLQKPDAKKDWLQRIINLLFGWFFKIFNKTFDFLSERYARLVKRVSRLVLVMLLLYGGLMALGAWEFNRVPGGFIPKMDQGYLILSIQLPDSASINRSREVVLRAGEIARGLDGVENTVEIAGFSGATRAISTNSAAIFIILDPFEERDKTGRSADVITAELQAAVGKITESSNVVIAPPPVRGLGTGGGFKLMLQDKSDNGYQALQEVTSEFLGKLNADPRVAVAFSTYRANTPQYFANVDREKAKALDVPLSNIFTTLQTLLGSTYVNDFNDFGRTYRVIAQAEDEYRDSPEDIHLMKVRSRTGALVPLGSLLDMERSSGPDRLVRHNLYLASEISGRNAPGVSSGEALSLVEELAEDLPEGYDFSWVDIAYQERAAGNTAGLVFAMAVVFVFLLLAAQYESWGLPLIIIMIVPMCIVGGITGVMLRDFDNNILVQIGFIVLIGLAAKNAILIVEFAKQMEDKGMDRYEAAIEACRLRLRPILMTSFAFILGVLPLVVAKGAGAEMRQALGTTVFSGMVCVTLFGLIFTPVFYVMIRGFTARKKDKIAAK